MYNKLIKEGSNRASKYQITCVKGYSFYAPKIKTSNKITIFYLQLTVTPFAARGELFTNIKGLRNTLCLKRTLNELYFTDD